ncbi:hypothetical protein FB45DRAFT_1008603 [Roridomyces roridus]|uniref:Nephrocystin 3-like N-terminal domain-containing protein n=1 Tax=Roridomyces roridus TaxID=1738132 RepID=A0AAD7B976_9AGAR|nr:hypothetical protein FB45DRAFT_1008603 [Roridomyces roridus]
MPPLIEGHQPVHIQNSTFNSAAGNLNVSNYHTTNLGNSGMDILLNAVAVDAMHNSAVRRDDPACHPGTRNAILERLDEWSFEQPEDGRIFWLHGCAGIGKSAIAQQFAAGCYDRGQLGAAFFFKRGDERRGNWRSLLPTLAYQLAASFPAISPMIQRAVETDRLVASKSMRSQLEKLIVLPLREVSMRNSLPILVLDGVDECEDHSKQTMLLRLLIEFVRSGLPIHILICSRSELHLREVLEASENSDICRGLQIHPDDAAFADVSRYLTDEFMRIRRIHTGRGVPSDNDWPGEEVIEQLVRRSSGTFIYASTIIRYVDDEYSHPVHRLNTVLCLDASSTTPLDDLYTQILSAIPNKPVLVRVLHAIMETDLDPEYIDIALHIPRGTSRITLRGLHSLLQVHPALQVPHIRIWAPWVKRSVTFLHASLRDFLGDPRRSSGFCISGQDFQITFVHSMAGALESWLQPLEFVMIASSFLPSLVKTPPTETIFRILRNVNAQDYAYRYYVHAGDILTWLEHYPHSPLDLIETWAELSHLQDPSLEELPWDTRSQSDEIFVQVVSEDPALLSFLRITSVVAPEERLSDMTALDLLGLKWDTLRPRVKFPFHVLRDFLCDPDRCGALYLSEQDTLRFIALRCMSRMNDILLTNNFFQFDLDWIAALCCCEPDEVVFGSLEHLDLSQFCGRLESEKEYHWVCHHDFLDPESFAEILDWLRELANSSDGIETRGPFKIRTSSLRLECTKDLKVNGTGLDILRRVLCEDAMHDSAVRPADPSCHPGTRDAIFERLDEWCFMQSENSAIFWLHGCAGIGKSAIAQQFAASCQARDQLGGSFFWKRGDAGRGHWRSLFPTLAYQLATSFPGIGPLVQRAVETDRLIASKSMRHQLEKLIILPLRQAPKLKSRPIWVLDGLDECEDHAIQTMLLRLLINSVRHGLPIHILICSRSESHLREVLQSSENSDICRGFQILPDDAASADISRYLTDEFTRIRGAHTSRGVTLDDGWPDESTIRELVDRSSGTFIYASTIVRYVDDDYSHPADRLDAVLSLDPSSTTPLDDLYTQILSVIPNKPVLLRVLHAVVETHLDPEQIDMALQMRRGASRITLRGLHSLIQLPPVRVFEHRITPVKLLHASFGDFLVDPQRSSDFCVSREEIALVRSMACTLQSGLQPADFEIITRDLLRYTTRIVPPTEDLFPILRNGRFHVDLPPLHLHLATDQRPVSSVCDEIYAQALSNNPEMVSALRVTYAFPDFKDLQALELLGLTWEVLLPLLELPKADLSAFLNDSRRCGTLYMSREETLRFIALRCINRMNDIFRTNNLFQFKRTWITTLCECEPDNMVFGALEQLDLAQLCTRLEPDKEYHLAWHAGSSFVGADCFSRTLNWLKKSPKTPPPLIESWERQETAVDECYGRVLRTENWQDLNSRF